MAIKLPILETSIFTSPKVMCTSVKWTALDLNQTVDTSQTSRPGFTVHQIYPLTEFDPDRMSSRFNYALVRDPVDRFVSLYKQKVLSLIMEKKASQGLVSSGLSLVPKFEEFLDRIDEYKRLSYLIDHHSKAQTYFLGTESAFYDAVHDLNESRKLEEILSKKAHRKITFQSKNVSDSSIDIDVSFWSSRKITELYREDYDAFGNHFLSQFAG